jgi:hypothetical protein
LLSGFKGSAFMQYACWQRYTWQVLGCFTAMGDGGKASATDCGTTSHVPKSWQQCTMSQLGSNAPNSSTAAAHLLQCSSRLALHHGS